MIRSSTFAKSLLAAASGVAALAIAASASAQPYGGSSSYYSGGNYDPCARQANGRGIAGGLIGGGLGAAIGANAGARGNRQDGALLGGALGAIAGAVIGNKSAACGTGGGSSYYSQPQIQPRASYGGDYYADRSYYGNPDAAYGRSSYYDDDDRGYAYGRRGDRYRVVAEQAPGRDGCTLAESPIYLPDGRVQKRFVRVCQDSNGRYQVVD